MEKTQNSTRTKQMRKEVTIIKVWKLERGVVNDLADQRAKNFTRLGESPEAASLAESQRAENRREAPGYLCW